jgi:inosose dehydratase
MAVRLGINPITWTNDDLPELGGDIPLETCLAETHMAGYAGTELGGKFPRETSALKSALDRNHLVLISGWYDGRLLEQGVEKEWLAVNDHLRLLRNMGCKHIVYADTSLRARGDLFSPMSKRPHMPRGRWPDYGRALTELSQKMQAFGVGMAFHHHVGTIVETDKEVDRLMASTGPEVGLLFDSGHSKLAGGNPLKLLQRHVDRVVHVHCKDVRKHVWKRVRAEDESFMQAVIDGVFTVPGDGCIDFPAILATLKTAGYSGWLVVEAEQDPKKAEPLAYARLGFSNLLRMATLARLEVEP